MIGRPKEIPQSLSDWICIANMVTSSSVIAVGLTLYASLASASPADPRVTAAPKLGDLDKRATSCTFSGSEGASSASKSKTSCSTIVLSDVAVPSGTTLDLTDLNEGTHVSSSRGLLPPLIIDRSSSKAKPPLATRNGMDLSSPSPGLTSPSRERMAPISTATAVAGGTTRAAMAARRSPSSSTPTI